MKEFINLTKEIIDTENDILKLSSTLVNLKTKGAKKGVESIISKSIEESAIIKEKRGELGGGK